MGIALCLGTVVQSGGGALGLAVQRGVVQSGGGALCFGAWWQLLEGGAAPVLHMPGGSSAARWPVIAREAMADWVGR